MYGQETPPKFRLKNIKDVAIALFYGGQDKLTTAADTETLLSGKLGCTPVYVQFEEEYGHLDFVWGYDAAFKIYPRICKLANKYYQRAKKQEEKKQKEELLNLNAEIVDLEGNLQEDERELVNDEL